MRAAIFLGLILFMAGFADVASSENTETSSADQGQKSMQDDMQTEVSKASADEDLGLKATTELQGWLDGFADKYGINYGILQDGRTFYYGNAVTRVGGKDPAYPKELVMAFEKAMLDMQGQAVMELYGRQVTSKLRDVYDDDSTDARSISFEDLEEKTPGKLERLIGKALSVTESKLDEMLGEMGHSEEELKSYDITRRKQLFRDTIKIQSMKEAVAQMSGLVPVQTRIIPTGGHATVGVIAVISDSTRQAAKDIGRQRSTYVRGRGMELKELLPDDESSYLNEFGLRYVFDDKGRPMLLSYGRWGVVQQSSDVSRRMRKIDNARERAQMLAEAAIANFISTSISMQQSMDTMSINESQIEQSANVSLSGLVKEGNPQLNDVQETLDIMFKNISARSDMSMKGTNVVQRWQAKDENGILHVGTVVAWSYDQLENADRIINQARDEKPAKPEQSSAGKSKESTTIKSRSSEIINDINDF